MLPVDARMLAAVPNTDLRVRVEHRNRNQHRPLWNLNWAKRPLLIYGAGIRHCREEAAELAMLLDVPIAPTWGAMDMFPESERSIGSFGTHGKRSANLAIQSSDWILAVGTRLDTKAMGTPPTLFAPQAKKWAVDIDQGELEKFERMGVSVIGICEEAKEWLQRRIEGVRNSPDGPHYFTDWQAQIAAWKAEYPLPKAEHYEAIAAISSISTEEDVICCDTGLILPWMMRAFRFKGQRFLHPWNQTPMGYAVPAAVGAHYATGKRVIVVTGDGSIMMNIGELATIAERNLPIKIFLFDNKGYGMVQQTQRQWFDGRYVASDTASLSFPNFERVAEAFGVDMTVIDIDPDAELEDQVMFGEALA